MIPGPGPAVSGKGQRKKAKISLLVVTAIITLVILNAPLSVRSGAYSLQTGDVALQEAMRWADRAELRPREKEAYARAEVWRPWRGVAAHLLWGWYGGVRRGEIALEDLTL